MSSIKGFQSLKHLKLLDLEGNIISEDAFVSNMKRNVGVGVGVNMNTAELNAELNAESNAELNAELNVDTNAESNVDSNVESTELSPFPASLQYLILRGNPICQNPEYRLIVTGAAPFIEELDEKRVTNLERRVALRSTKYI